MEGQRFIILSNWRSTLVPQPATLHDGCQQLFADQLHRVTDRPHKVNDWSHEVTDWHHQACVGTFELFDTNNTPYFTHLSNGSLVPSRPQIKWVCSLVPRHTPSFSQSWGRGGWWTQTHAWSPHMPGLHHIQVVDHIKMVDNTNVK